MLHTDHGMTELRPEHMAIIRALLRGRKLRKFQYGGVVRRPTIGLLGEAGPEAVVPLTRQARSALRTRPRRSGPGTTIGGLIGDQEALGPGYLRQKIRREAQRTAEGQRRRTDVLSRLAGLNPMQQRTAMVESEIEAGRGLSDVLGRADIEGARGYQDFVRDMLKQERQIEAERQAREAEQGSLGGFLGSLAGSFIPGVGQLGGLFRRRRGTPWDIEAQIAGG